MSADNSMMSSKDVNTFKKLAKCYESKQFRNGLRFAKLILANSKCVNHAETIAYKGMCLSGIGRNEEALEVVKNAVKIDLRCALAWRAYGLVLRAERKYEEAVKCFRNALKIDRDNLDNWRDLSVIQIQLRDLESLKESRQAICQLKPGLRASWAGLAMSYHLTGDFEMARHILNNFTQRQSKVDREVVSQFMKHVLNNKMSYDYEHSELLLYENMVIR